MEKQLFTKLQDPHCCSFTEQIVRSVTEDLLERSAQLYQNKQLKQISINILREEVMHKEYNSIGQAYIQNPYEVLMSEDFDQVTHFRCRSNLSTRRIDPFPPK